MCLTSTHYCILTVCANGISHLRTLKIGMRNRQSPEPFSKGDRRLPGELRSRIHERTISVRFLGIILRDLRLELSVYNVYITVQTSFKPLLLKEGGGRVILVEVAVNSKEENSEV